MSTNKNIDSLPGEQWTPSNRTIADSFISDNCNLCGRDEAARQAFEFDRFDEFDVCEILAAGYLGEAVEWRHLPTGEVKCLAFISADQPIPALRCNKTIDMFEI